MNVHVMHLNESLRRGGVERILVDLANATSADGHRVSTCLLEDGRDLANELRPEIQLWVLARRKRFEREAMKQLGSIVTEQKVDLLHVHGRSTYAFAALARTLGFITIPILLHDHYGQIETDAAVPWWFRLWGHRHVDRYVGVYGKLADWAVRAGVPRARTCVIGNAIDLERVRDTRSASLRSEFGFAEAERIGIVVCGLRREKGIPQLLEALSKLSGRHAVKILVVGGERETGHVAACKAKAFSLGLNDLIQFTGERADVPALIRGADFALLPSLSESGPLVLIEYMAGGLPFVATLVGDIAHRVDKLGGSQFVPPRDPAAFAEALDRLLSLAPDDWRARREASQRLAFDHFDVRQTMPRWYRMYREALRLIHA